MAVSRRRFLGSSAAAGAAAAVAPQLSLAQGLAQPANPAPAAAGDPPLAVIALNRMGYGPRPGDIDAFLQLGGTPEARLSAYVDQQLNPDDASDTVCQQKLASVKQRISYQQADGSTFTEDRPLRTLNQSLAELWSLRTSTTHGAEYNRPTDEVRTATWLRAVYSKWQLREVLTEFWHNHFSVNAFADYRISITLPLYDRLMRANWNGNFRTLLEGVAQSVAMQYSLNNVTNRVGGPNENYARELFELHTLGSNNYFNTLYNRWSDVPGAKNSPVAPIGYIDEDVYEAARAFTGWTIADGYAGQVPNTGEFMIVKDWHDRFQKRVLATEFDPDQSALDDGRRVLDLVAYHPGTARHLCFKLCRRLVADQPSEALVQRAAEVWLANKTDPQQIAKTLRVILLSDEFKQTWGAKIKRPFEMLASYIRTTGMEFPPKNLFNTGLVSYHLEYTGHRMFSWPTPTGNPDTMDHWLSSNVMLRRWNLSNELMMHWFWGLPSTEQPFNLMAQHPPDVVTSRQIVTYWVGRMIGRPLPPATFQELLRLVAQAANPDSPPTGGSADLIQRINTLCALIAMTPEFQMR
ncbi:MAG TPA: DUF1800 domain-containing protein [Roseiflexaceae bacterium]|nr:DUF1800 domain-containing protein [Roseiflexaceae bacterium]